MEAVGGGGQVITLSSKELCQIAIQGFGAMQKQGELERLVRLVKEHSDRALCRWLDILEIGAGNGGTSWIWSKLGKLATIDLPNGPWGGTDLTKTFEYIREHAVQGVNFLPADSKSGEALDFAKAHGPYDFVFIDGDHSYEGVKGDFERYAGLVRDGGIIAFHDIQKHPPEAQCEVEKFWTELKSTDIHSDRMHFYEFIEEAGGPWAGIGVVRL